MLTSTLSMLEQAELGGYAVGAFNVYNLEGISAVCAAAAELRSPAILQIHPAAYRFAGPGLLSAALDAAARAAVPIAVHLDHCSDPAMIAEALEAGCPSVMADGSHLSVQENTAFVRMVADVARKRSAHVEAELGLLSGSEDGLTVPERAARMTDPEEARDFAASSGADFLAVCIGNVHGRYREPPRLDLDRLSRIRDSVSVPLVLHGASGLDADAVRSCIDRGIRKLNVNTELREAYLGGLARELSSCKEPELIAVLKSGTDRMSEAVKEKIRLFRSEGTSPYTGSPLL